MRGLFLSVASLGLVYFLLARRRFDFFSLAFLSAVFYFLPGFFGLSLRIYEDGRGYVLEPLVPEVYGVMSLVLAAVLLGAFVRRPGPPAGPFEGTFCRPETVLAWLLVIGGVALIGVLSTTGRALLLPSKIEMRAFLNRWMTILNYASAGAFVLAVTIRSRWGVLLSAGLLGVTLVAAERAVTVHALMGAFIVWAFRQPPARFLIARWRLGVAAAAVAAFFLLWQQFLWSARVGDWDRVRDLAADRGIYRDAVMQSEPFVIQGILNAVLQERFSISGYHYMNLFALAVPFYSDFFQRSPEFQELFQPVLFPEVRNATLVGTAWAEAVSAGGTPLLVVYVVLFVAGLFLANRIQRSRSAVIVSAGGIAFAYFAFYVHRNEAFYLLLLMRGHLLVFLLASTLAAFQDFIGRRIKEGTGGSVPGAP